MSNPVPPLRRDLEFIPVQHEGEQLALVRDHLGLVAEGQALKGPLFPLLSLLDGERTAAQAHEELLKRQDGQGPALEEVEQVLAELDKCFFLESEHYRAAREQIVNAFAAETVRSCALCGTAYPAEAEVLAPKLDELIALAQDTPELSGQVKALVAPHIDPGIGAKTYAAAYACLKDARPERVIILGVGHQMASGLFCPTDKDFDTPLGLVANDKETSRSLAAIGDAMVEPLDFLHRSEHSIEFQALLLRHVLPKDSFSIVPVLCGTVLTALKDYTRQAFLDTAGPFLDALRALAADPSTLVVAGVDFAHIGLKFGHPMEAEKMETLASEHDTKLLEALTALDQEAFWAESARVEDRFNICGFTALAVLSEILPPCQGTRLDHAIWHEPPTKSAVSFASAVFTAK